MKPFLKSFGTRIRKRREYCELSQDDLARYVGISAPTMSRIESGDIDITIRRAMEIATQLDVTLRELMEGLL